MKANNRFLIGISVASLAIAASALALVVWIAADPEHWFPGAYAERGVRGPVGEQGSVGRQGPAGPVEAVDASQFESDLADVQSTLEALCSQLSLSDGVLYDIYINAC